MPGVCSGRFGMRGRRRRSGRPCAGGASRWAQAPRTQAAASTAGAVAAGAVEPAAAGRQAGTRPGTKQPLETQLRRRRALWWMSWMPHSRVRTSRHLSLAGSRSECGHAEQVEWGRAGQVEWGHPTRRLAATPANVHSMAALPLCTSRTCSPCSPRRHHQAGVGPAAASTAAGTAASAWGTAAVCAHPRCPMRASASSRRLPFSTPLETRGMGMSRWMRYTRTQGGTSAMMRATRSTSCGRDGVGV